jgi:FlaA1/EpsC-like NDP-sugar epimerase
MNKIDTSHSFTADAVRAHQDGEPQKEPAGKLNPTALQIASQYRRDTMSPVMVSGMLRLVEFALLALSGLLVSLWYVGAPVAIGLQYLLTTFIGAGMAVILLELSEGYRMSFLRRPGARLGRLMLIWAGTLALIALGAFFLKISEDYSRVWFAGWFVSGLIVIVALRVIIARLIVRWARNGTMERRAVIVGGGKAAEALIRSLEREPANDIRICGIFDDRDNTRSPPVVAGYPKLGTVEN